jgi:hypothetical protein
LKNAIRLATFLLALAATSFAGVNVSSPAEGAVTNSPLHVVASASPFTGKAITAGQVYIDGKLAFQHNGSSFDTYINVSYGRHDVTVKFWDAAGANSMVTRHTTGSGSGVTISSPANNSVSSNGWVQLKATAFSPNNVVALQVYDNGTLIKQVNSGSMDVGLQLNGSGSHYLAVQAWDSNGTTFLSPVVVNVGTAQPQPQTGGGSTDKWGPQVGIPGGATAKYDIDEMGGWESCDSCAGPGGHGVVDPYAMTQNLNNPSLDGKSATFWLGGTVPWGAALWWKQLGAIDSAKHFVYDLAFFIKDPKIAQALEFDMNQSVNGLKYIFGTECGTRNNAGWRIWDTANVRWVSTGKSCNPKANEWNHLTWEFERVGNQTHFIAVTLNGYRQVVDKWFYSRPVGGVRELNVAIQIDGNEHQDDYQIWADKVAMYAW